MVIVCHNQSNNDPRRGDPPYDCVWTSRARINGGEWVKVCSWCAKGMPFASFDYAIVFKKIFDSIT